MKKRICIFLYLFLVLPLTVFAASPYVVDEADLLTDAEAAELIQRCIQFRDASGLELVILTVDDLGGKTAIAYADDYFDAHYGENGILLLISMAERDWCISTCGTAIEAFADTDLMDMEDGIMKYLPEGDYSRAFHQFVYDAEYYWCDEGVSDLEASLSIGIIAGAVIALITLLILRGTMNTKRSQHSAGSYEVEGSYNLRRHQDLFLYSKVSKQANQKNNSSSGSSVHTSSSGRSHGGRSGKF